MKTKTRDMIDAMTSWLAELAAQGWNLASMKLLGSWALHEGGKLDASWLPWSRTLCLVLKDSWHTAGGCFSLVRRKDSWSNKSNCMKNTPFIAFLSFYAQCSVWQSVAYGEEKKWMELDHACASTRRALERAMLCLFILFIGFLS